MDHGRTASEPKRLTLSTCSLDVETSPNQVVVTLAGELDMSDADQVAGSLIAAAEAGKPIVRLDLSGLTFADSSAVKAILMGAQAAEEHGVAYALVNPHGRVQRLLEVTGLTSALTIINEPANQEGPNSL